MTEEVCRLFTNVAVLCPRTRTIHDGEIHSDKGNAIDKIIARITNAVDLDRTDWDRMSFFYLLNSIFTHRIFPSTCGLGKFQILSKFAKSSWSSGCGLNLCRYHTNYIFTWHKNNPNKPEVPSVRVLSHKNTIVRKIDYTILPIRLHYPFLLAPHSPKNYTISMF